MFRRLFFIAMAMLIGSVGPIRMPQAMAQAAARSASSGVGNSDLAELVRTAQHLRSLEARNPNSETVKKLKEVIKTSGDRIVSRIAKELDRLAREKLQEPGFQQKWDALESELAEIAKIQKEYTLPFVVLIDPNKPATRDNIMRGEFRVDLGETDQVKLESPKNIKYRLSQMAAAGKRTGIQFTSQYTAFAIADGLIRTSYLTFNLDGSPVSLQELERSIKSPEQAVSFAIFMASSHPVAKLLQGVRSGRLPKSLIPYISMSAGFMASSILSEMFADKDMHACIASRFRAARGTGKVDEEACQKTYTTWAIHNKIIQYFPTIVSMLGSTALAAPMRSAVTGGFKLAENSKVWRYVFKGATLSPRLGREAAIAASGGFTPIGIALAAGDFVLFLAADKFVTPVVNDLWEGFQIDTFNLKTWLDKWGLHRDFLWPQDSTRIPIANAFDVQATSLKTAHEEMTIFLNRMAGNDWTEPSKPELCTASRKPVLAQPLSDALAAANEAASKTAPGRWLKSFAGSMANLVKVSNPLMATVAQVAVKSAQVGERLGTRIANRKTGEDLRCEVQSQPYELVDRFGEMNLAHRKHLYSQFTTLYNGWLELIAQFSQQYQAVSAVVENLAKAKYDEVHGKGKRPDLSRKGINQMIMAALIATQKSTDPDSTGPLPTVAIPGSPATMGFLVTPEMADYVIAGLACGPKGSDEQKRNSAQSIGLQMKELFKKFWDNPSYINTPFGSSFQFLPPNITSKNGEICAPAHPQMALAMISPTLAIARMAQDKIREWMRRPRNELRIFEGQWQDTDGKQYTNLAEYVYDRMDPAVYDSKVGVTDVSTWWTNEIAGRIAPVWKTYEKQYQLMVAHKFAPAIDRRQMKIGCSAVPTNQADLLLRSRMVDHGQVWHPAPKPFDELGFRNMTAVDYTGYRYDCNDKALDYRVSLGLRDSIEIELRTYFRGISSLYVSLHAPKDRPAARARIVEKVNAFLNEWNRRLPVAKAYSPALDRLGDIMKLFDDHSTFSKTITSPAYKEKLLKNMYLWADASISDLKLYGEFTWMMDFSGAVSRPSVQKPDNHVDPDSILTGLK